MGRGTVTAYPIIALGEKVEGAPIAGRVGTFTMLPISQLVVDDAYQRTISSSSARNIRRICRNFDWSKFLPVIVTKDGGKYSIVDGQHRATAALTLGITEVPCYVLGCTPSEAAAAFAAINGNVTPMQTIDIWFAELAAGDPSAVLLKGVLDAAGVTVTRKKDGYIAGETRSIGVLRRALQFYGEAILTTILQCIVETGDGNAGMIFGAVINGIGHAVRTKPDLLSNPTKLFDVFDQITLSAVVYDAQVESARTGNVVQQILTRVFNAAIAAAEVRRAA
jgi:hypothetical protein